MRIRRRWIVAAFVVAALALGLLLVGWVRAQQAETGVLCGPVSDVLPVMADQVRQWAEQNGGRFPDASLVAATICKTAIDGRSYDCCAWSSGRERGLLIFCTEFLYREGWMSWGRRFTVGVIVFAENARERYVRLYRLPIDPGWTDKDLEEIFTKSQ